MWASGTKTAVPTSNLYVSNGDVASEHFDKNDFTWDNAWRILDVSSVVPAGVKLIHIRVIHLNVISMGVMTFRKNGYSNIKNSVSLSLWYTGTVQHDVFAEVDADRKLEYKGDTSPTSFNMVIKGWVLEV